MAEIIRDIKMSDAKLWFIKLYDDGYFYSNPFDFRLDIIPNNTQKRVALPPKQQE